MSINSKMTAIADNIRAITGNTDKLNLDKMADGVMECYNKGIDEGFTNGNQAGYDAGKSDGITEGYNEGYNTGKEEGIAEGHETGYWEGYNNGETNGHQAGWEEGTQVGYENGKADGITEGIEQGKKSEYDKFWDAYQDYGNRTNYERAFAGYGWTDANFYPKYDIVIVENANASSLFHVSQITNLKSRLEECGVVLDTSKCKSFYQTFQQSTIRVFPTIDLRNAYDTTNYCFYNCGAETIEKVIISEQTNLVATTFGAMWSLKNITIEGIIAKGGVTFDKSHLLTKASITSIINALSPTTSGLAITLSQTAVNKAFTTSEWDALIATKTNWTISLV